MKYQLRDYQELTIESIFQWFYENTQGNPIVNACVGAGKSIIIAELCKRVINQWPNQRILMAVASRELVAQNFEKLHSIYPEGKLGLYSAGLGKKNPHAQIVFATIGSIYNKAMHTGAFNVCIIDECHNVSRKETGMYRQMIADYTRLNPGFRVIGFTGTPFRGNGILLTEGKEALFTDIAATVSITDMLARGFLSPLVLADTVTKTDVTGVSINGATGDYNVNELAKAIDRDEITTSAVNEIIAAGQNRKSWLIFGVDVKHCEHIHEKLKSLGIYGAVVHGKTPKGERDLIIKQYKLGRIRYIVNCMVLTVGFDAPGTDLIALIRNTKSPVLYVQIGGRGMRTAPGKSDCLWMDFTDTTYNLGPIDKVKGRLEPKKKSSSGPVVKICPVCKAQSHANVRFCGCGHEFEILHDETIRQHSSDAPILAGVVYSNAVEVSNWRFNVHKKPGSPDSLCVTYLAVNEGNLPGAKYQEWACFNHQGFARRKAENHWLKLGGLQPIPASVDDAFLRLSELKKPDSIHVIKNGKFYEVISHGYNTPNPTTETAPNTGGGAFFRDFKSNSSNNTLPRLP